MTTTYDIAIIGAGAVGCAVARELSRYQIDIALVEANSDVGMGTSKSSTAIWHTGYDSKPGSLESKLLRRSYPLMKKFMQEANIAHENLGGILIAWNEEQLQSLSVLLERARQNGETDCYLIDKAEVYKREPNLGQGALGGMMVPGEGILCTFSVPIACAYQAVVNGVELILDHPVKKIEKQDSFLVLDDEIRARYVVNAAGLFSDEVNAQFGQTGFTVKPRRGQLIVYDKLARNLINHVLLPVPTSKTKGVLVTPTVYGNILLGPTAEDLSDKTATQTTEEGLQMLIEQGKRILPSLILEEVTATYSGLRAATEYGDYQIGMDAEKKYLYMGGIRSTGISGALGIAEYAAELLGSAGLTLNPKDEFKKVKLSTIGEAGIRPFQNAVMIAHDAAYAEIICHCEHVSRGELRDAMSSPVPAKTLDALRRRTRAWQGRCQGFNCQAALVKIVESGNAHSVNSVFGGESIKNEQIQSTPKKVDVVIVGAGPAGLSAGIELKKLGVNNILVVDREAEAGGMPRMCHHTGFGREDLWRFYSGPRYARHYRELAEQWNVDVQTSTTVTGWKQAHEKIHSLAFTSPSGIGTIEARAVLLATGVRERPRSARLIPGTRPPGIFTTGSLQRYVYQEHLPVGKHAVIVGAELVSLSALMTLMHAGVKCEFMVTEADAHQIKFPYIVMKWLLVDIMRRASIVTRAKVSNIFGKKKLEGIELKNDRGETKRVECDTLIFTGNWIPEHEIARLGGLIINPITRGPQVDTNFQSSVEGVFVAGNLLRGVETADHCALEGKRVARSIAQFLNQKYKE